MIQRIQSLYLLLVFLLSVALFFVPLYTNEILDATNGTHDFHYINCLSNPLFLLMNSFSGILSFVILLLYKKRKLQVQLCGLSILFSCIFIGVVFYYSENRGTLLINHVDYDAGVYLILIQLILTFLAMRAIRKDEALVRSADRLR